PRSLRAGRRRPRPRPRAPGGWTESVAWVAFGSVSAGSRGKTPAGDTRNLASSPGSGHRTGTFAFPQSPRIDSSDRGCVHGRWWTAPGMDLTRWTQATSRHGFG